MSYDKGLAGRIRKVLSGRPGVSEQAKMGGVTFMLDGKVCVRAHSDGSIMVRCDPSMTEQFLKEEGVRRFEMKGRPLMKGWILVSSDQLSSEKGLDQWIGVSTDTCSKLL